MRNYIVIWIVICAERVLSNEAINKETENQVVHTYHTNNPTIAKRFWWHIQTPQYDPYKRGSRPDRFRFFHQGLGKRTSEKRTSEDISYNEPHLQKSGLLESIKKLIKDSVRDGINDQITYTAAQQVSANPFLERTPTYRALKGVNTLYDNKRTPEVFSESLYPIQAGKQRLEVTIDRSLNDKGNKFDYDMKVDDEATLDDYNTDNPEVIGDIQEPSVEHKITKTPYDLIFGSPDLGDSKLYNTIENDDDDDKELNDNDIINDATESSDLNDERTKRWWAAEKFRKFRSANSWAQYGRRGKHIDPALYFIGLGK
ncbi:hypothetical protein ACF0H5_014055 [Mactra antiquata]